MVKGKFAHNFLQKFDLPFMPLLTVQLLRTVIFWLEFTLSSLKKRATTNLKGFQ